MPGGERGPSPARAVEDFELAQRPLLMLQVSSLPLQPSLTPQTCRHSPTVMDLTQCLKAPCPQGYFAFTVQLFDPHLCSLYWVLLGPRAGLLCPLPPHPHRPQPLRALVPGMGLLHSRGRRKPGWLNGADLLVWG